MRNSTRAVRQLAFLFILISVSGGTFAWTQAVDWKAEYDKLKAKIDAEFDKPTVSEAQSTSDPIGEFIRWMGIKAADRNKANGFAAQAQAAGNPYWEKMFTDLQELAQESGDGTLWKGMMKYMKIRDGDQWSEAVWVCGPQIGRRLYTAAETLGFDKEMVRNTARCLMRFANRDLEYGKFAYYSGRTNYIGTMDAGGVITLPQGNFNVDCERRNFFHVQDKGEPLMPADMAMESGEMIRETCEFYGLGPERQDATDLMEQYLKEKKVLCEMPPGKGHSFFKKLAEDHELPGAEEHIKGFYAKLKGKVEIEDEGKREPAPGAVVTVKDNEDNRTWQATANADGKYEIKEVILHKNCSPFDIKAEYEGYTEEDTYEGSLEEPDRSKEYEKDLLIVPAAWEGTIEYRWSAVSAKGESLTTTILPGGEFEAAENWRLWVKLKKDRGNENIEVFALSSARLELFEEKLDAKVMDMRKDDRSIKVDMKDSATARFRPLTSKECSLELAVNKKRNTYILSGGLHVKGIPLTSQSKMDMVKAPIDQRLKDSGRGTVGIDQSLELEGSLAADAPERVRGSKDLIQELGPEAKKFLESIGGKQTSVIRWDLAKRKKK